MRIAALILSMFCFFGQMPALAAADMLFGMPAGSLLAVKIITPTIRRGGMAVYVGHGKLYSAAHLFQGLALGDTVQVYADTLDVTQEKPRPATLTAMDARRDTAILTVPNTDGLVAQAPCADAPDPGERVTLIHFRGGPDDRIFDVGPADIFATPVQRLPDYPPGNRYHRHAGLFRYVFMGGAAPGMSGGPAWSVTHQCFYGVVSFVDDFIVRDLTAAENPYHLPLATIIVPVSLFPERQSQ